jgi:hypothetical protein
VNSEFKVQLAYGALNCHCNDDEKVNALTQHSEVVLIKNNAKIKMK